ncbi:TetR/AcrR family transcriptional regulator [Streptomyces lateritius]|uniref:TetR/AcrR family transcriptional regulator n=1 Tax=Streptomyces lateritius TaxID=67313 RepID=UPI001C8B7F87|nr:TetR/AcrR family transcriptional regulator [Streptomyces lateritius]MBX9426561.1 TetR family transcriptional regulator [Streptomyces lateritius]
MSTSAASPASHGTEEARTEAGTHDTSGAGTEAGGRAATAAPDTPAVSRAERIGDAALDLLVERGMRGLTHRAVDERAGLPQGSTSNHARTRQALLETAVRRQVQLEARVLTPDELPGAGGGGDARVDPHVLVDALSLALHRYLTDHRALLVSRYELALEATRRPELRVFFDAAGSVFRGPLVAMAAAAGSTEPERHALSLIAWAEGLMFSCAVGSFHSTVPGRAELRTGIAELLRGMLGDRPARG